MSECRCPRCTDASLSIIIPTIGRASLTATLDSIANQHLTIQDEVLVCGDTSQGRKYPGLADVVHAWGPQFYYAESDAGPSWGNPQRNAMIQAATKNWLLFIDDDDIYLPHALDTIRNCILATGKREPHYFRFIGPNNEIYWKKKKQIVMNTIGGHCIAAPNDPRTGRWGDRYQGDFDFIQSTSTAFLDRGHWFSYITSVSRPLLFWSEVTTEEHLETLRRLRNEGRATLSRNTDEISQQAQTDWWEKRDPARTVAYLFMKMPEDDAPPVVVGSGLLTKREDDRWWITVIVRPDHQGHRFGRTIFHWLAAAAPEPIHAEILRTNIPSIRACTAAGYLTKDINMKTVLLQSDVAEAK